MSKSLSVSGAIDSQSVAIYDAVNAAAQVLDIPYLVVGASARDLVMHLGYGAPVRRATRDIDFGIQVESWGMFERLKHALIEKGFKESRAKQRLLGDTGWHIDIVPFGAVEEQGASIHWPPDGSTVMSVLGFREAWEHSDRVVIQDSPRIEIPVASPVGIGLLKLIAWMDRDPDIRRKDAQDLLYLLQHYEQIPEVSEGMYDHPALMEKFGWDTLLVGAYLIGVQVCQIAHPSTREAIGVFIRAELKGKEPARLVNEMSSSSADFERNDETFAAFVAGIQSIQTNLSDAN